MQSFPIQDFGGLDLATDVEQLGFGGTIDCLNVDFNKLGRVTTRTGYAAVNGSAASVTALKSVFYDQASGYVLLSGYSGGAAKIIAYTTPGVATYTVTPASGLGYMSAVAIGTPTASTVYIAGDEFVIRKFTAAGFATTTGLPAARWLTNQPDDNRLVAARTSTNNSRVSFSDPGAPETFGANNYVDLTPGDGQAITGACSWRNLVFVFKASRFFVFYGNSVDTAGEPIFTYRTVDAGVGAYGGTNSNRVCVSGREGVYFYSGDAIYLSTGGPAQKISQKIEPFLLGLTSVPFAGAVGSGTLNDGEVNLSYDNGRLFVNVSATGGATSTVTFIWDPQTSTWTVYDAPVRQIANGYFVGQTAYFYKLSSSYTTDNGVAFASHYQSGFGDLGQPGFEKTIRETELSGVGTVTFGWARDLQASPTLTSVAMGSSPSAYGNRAWDRVARVGDTLSFRVQGTSAWTLDRLVAWVRETRNEETA